MSKTETKIKDCWMTPFPIIERVDAFFEGEWFDPCPTNPRFDGLAVKWPAKTYINPPFSEYLKWVKHGRLQPLEQIWMCDHDHSTERFQDLMPGATLCMLFDRVAFVHPLDGKPIKGNPRCQSLVYRGNHVERFRQHFQGIGMIATEVGFE